MPSRDYSATPLATKLVRRRAAAALRRAEGTLAPADGLWIVAEEASKIDTDLSFEIVHEAGLAAGLVDSKSASIDESRQALRFVYRLADRPTA